jgi:hypothetical protein
MNIDELKLNPKNPQKYTGFRVSDKMSQTQRSKSKSLFKIFS